ncbi:response regulator transcription factor [Bacillus aquiflavi]|uniref:Response regulator transcription factor n=1 Tax=Bacillus aquiflavi TaxID=2672567 RepID=A0A6B3VYN5_9BACI|nr:response regulator transcription factor [Bacillus aquiflavi]MBA4536343.1 response regulator transcription factor [Bacillus aquiflavi]NEY80711.1 response regulator transcription factor [Bacillus aquiflavi]
MKHNVLLVEDDESIAEMVESHLLKEGFIVKVAYDGEEAVHTFLNDSFDIILLDLMLPKLDGMTFMKIIREKSLIPILIMSAKDSDVDKALGLGFGADDYISKPFSMIELTARVKAAIRRATDYTQSKREEGKNFLQIGNLQVDLSNYSVVKNGEKLQLTAKEFNILKLFVQNPSRVYTKEQIYNLIWHEDYYGDENIINVHIRRIREKIEENPSSPQYIKTLWGIGYKLGEF